MNNASDLTLFWGIDGGVEMIKLLHQYGVDLSRRTPKDWTPLSYAKAKGKYGATEEKGIYPEASLLKGVHRNLLSLSKVLHACKSFLRRIGPCSLKALYQRIEEADF